jgi:outer membrane protein assembly factor BamD (BamD/ComL family)
MKGLSVVAVSFVVVACGGNSGVQTAPVPQASFAATLSQASADASAGRFTAADKTLADFSLQHPASGEAVEAMYWRAIYQLDPANTAVSMRDATALLDSYIAAPGASRRAEAVALRRVLTALDATKATAAIPVPAKSVDAPATDKAKDDEIARLKDELAKANAELERIKRRLAKP